ncbi:MAG: peptidylprolyl isomerase [Robiginitomaculum sp.]
MLTACGGNPHVILETDLGPIELEIFEDKAPLSAGDFLYHVDQGLYTGQGFYRVVRPDNDPRKMGMALIQGGLLSLVPVTQAIEHEPTSVTGLSHQDGVISIARDGVGTGSAAYFFITVGDNSFLDHGGKRNSDGQGYAAFGQVVAGMDVVKAIQALDSTGPSEDEVTKGQYLEKPVSIKTARRK